MVTTFVAAPSPVIVVTYWMMASLAPGVTFSIISLTHYDADGESGIHPIYRP